MTATLFTDPRPRRAKAIKPPPAPIFGPLAVGSIVLAIDPSTTCCGWGVIEKTATGSRRIDSGNIRPKANGEDQVHDTLAMEVFELARRTWTINRVDYKPTDAIIEIPWGGRGGVPLTVYARGVGVCEAACKLAGLSMNRVRATDWKLDYKMSGMDSKDAAMFWTRQLFGYAPREHNEADALMVGEWVCRRKA